MWRLDQEPLSPVTDGNKRIAWARLATRYAQVGVDHGVKFLSKWVSSRSSLNMGNPRTIFQVGWTEEVNVLYWYHQLYANPSPVMHWFAEPLSSTTGLAIGRLGKQPLVTQADSQMPVTTEMDYDSRPDVKFSDVPSVSNTGGPDLSKSFWLTSNW